MQASGYRRGAGQNLQWTRHEKWQQLRDNSGRFQEKGKKIIRSFLFRIGSKAVLDIMIEEIENGLTVGVRDRAEGEF